MNRRIRELAEQAGFRNGTFDGFWIDNDGVNRFAELIVRECANIAADQSAIRPEYRIRKHFGVEE